jgi:hypothetical protein
VTHPTKIVMIIMAIQSVGESAIDAASRRNGKLFAAYIVVLIVTALIIAVFTWLTWDSGNKVQDAIRQDADARIREANKGVEKLRNDNLLLSGSVAGLEKTASDAKTAQQKVEIQLAKQQERAAAAEARLLELQRGHLPRMLSADAIEFMRGKPTGTAEIMYRREDSEAALFAEFVFAWLGSNGWRVSKPVPIPENISAEKILEVLRAAPLGVTVAVKEIPDNPKRDDPYSVLMDIFGKSLVLAYGARDTSLPDNVFRIIVMQRP